MSTGITKSSWSKLQMPLSILRNLLLDNKTFFFFPSPRKEPQASPQHFAMSQGSPSPLPILSQQGEKGCSNQREKASQEPGSPLPQPGWGWGAATASSSAEGAGTGHNKARTRKKSDLPEHGAMFGLFLTSHLKLRTVCISVLSYSC